MKMNRWDVLQNLQKFDMWDFKKYPLSVIEAEVIMDALERVIKRECMECINKFNCGGINDEYNCRK